jgi:manganese oxidase
MTHHVMNQMGHEAPNTIGVDAEDADRRIQKIIPGYMTMGQAGMGGMAEMGMPVPDNSVPMLGAAGPFGFIDMGGMFTIVKIRDHLPAGGGDPGWYKHPDGTVSSPATAAQLQRDGIAIDDT